MTGNAPDSRPGDRHGGNPPSQTGGGTEDRHAWVWRWARHAAEELRGSAAATNQPFFVIVIHPANRAPSPALAVADVALNAVGVPPTRPHAWPNPAKDAIHAALKDAANDAWFALYVDEDEDTARAGADEVQAWIDGGASPTGPRKVLPM
ncbi:MAG: hypothetical protein ACKOWF_17305 [Chloroflexota bacterium]